MNEQRAEIGEPKDDSRAFRRALGQFATGVTIVTVAPQGRCAGLTVNSFASVSLDPPLVLCSVARSSRSFVQFQQATHLAVNVLAADQVQLASVFAASAQDKFHGVDWRAGIGGAPLLQGVAATLECRIHQRVEGGDHVVYLCEVMRYARHDRPVLLYANGRFGLVVDYPAAKGQAQPLRPMGDSMLGLLWDAFSRLSGEFQSERDAEGLSVDEGRVLAHIERYPGASLEFMASHSFLGVRVIEDAIAVLASAGLVAAGPGGAHVVTDAGRRRVESLRQRGERFEARQFERISPHDLQVARRVLRTIGAVQGPEPAIAQTG